MNLNISFPGVLKTLAAGAGLLAGLAQAAAPIWLPSDAMPAGSVLLQVEELKATYLQCDRLASHTMLDMSSAADCSVAAERLRRIGFDGHADGVLDWWKVMTQARRPAAPAGPSAPTNDLVAASTK